MDTHFRCQKKIDLFCPDYVMLKDKITGEQINLAAPYNEYPFYDGHVDEVYTVVALKNANFVVSGGRDGKIIVWEVEGKRYNRIHTVSKVTELLLSENGQTLVALYGNECVGVFRMKDDNPIEWDFNTSV